VCVCAVVFFVWWQFFHEGGERPTVRRKPREIPKGPAMAVPKSRVRPRR
jgi:hypothetical protein